MDHQFQLETRKAKPETPASPLPMPSLENEQHESFAQARFAGKTLVEAHYAAGYAGDKASASRLNQLHEVKERIAELYRERATETAYEKTSAVRDLLAIIHTAPFDAEEDNPMCEVRIGKDGPYHRLPGKLQAMARLIKLMGWDHPVEIKVELKNNFLDHLSSFVLRKNQPPTSSAPAWTVACRTQDGDDLGRRGDVAEPPEPSPAGTAPCLSREEGKLESGASAPAILGHPASSIQTPASSIPLSARQESYAVARVKGMSIMASYHAAGYTGHSPNLAWRLNSMPAVRARINELNGEVENTLGYHRDDAARDLILIIRATPSEVGPDHPYCEKRVTSWGTYHRFPSKLVALTLLARLLNWNGPTKLQVAHDPDKGFKDLHEFISKRS
jgi:hypothetical protein